MKILVMGLPGSGKTTFANELINYLPGYPLRLNADAVRKIHNDWDFSLAGRLRQADRMRALADAHEGYVVADFIAPTEESRHIFGADYIIWMNTIGAGRYDDTNAMFVPPKSVNLVITNFDYNIKDIAKLLV